MLFPFQGFDDQCLGVIALYLRPATFTIGEVIYELGDRGNEMFFVIDGTVVVHANSPCAVKTLNRPEEGGSGDADKVDGEGIVTQGDVFGEGGLFPGELGPLRLESAKSLSFVLAFVLTAASMREIEAECPAVNSYALACRCRPAFSCATAVKFLSLSSKTEI